jgi:hypothetical protein
MTEPTRRLTKLAFAGQTWERERIRRLVLGHLAERVPALTRFVVCRAHVTIMPDEISRVPSVSHLATARGTSQCRPIRFVHVLREHVDGGCLSSRVPGWRQAGSLEVLTENRKWGEVKTSIRAFGGVNWDAASNSRLQ